jgi:DNA-binding NarL/FixJ family response regulator
MRLAVCDEQWLFASVLATALAQQGHQIVLTTDSPSELLTEVPRLQPEICVLDLAPSVVELAEQLHAFENAPAVVLLTGFATDEVWSAYEQGLLQGVVNKACAFPVLVEALDRVAAGEQLTEGWQPAERRQERGVVDALTTRELEVLRLVVQGHSTQTMADQLGVSRHTIRTHVQQVLRKLDVHGRGKLARAAAAAGLIDVAALTSSEVPHR